jgi:Ca2+-binding RTX toxin-like protein
VAENAANALVGTLSALDPDAGDTFTFTLVDDAGGRFAIDGNNLRTTGALDFENQESWSIQVKVTDSNNNSFQDTFLIQVGDVNGFTIKGSQGNDVISATKTVAGQHKATGEEDTITGRGGNDSINGAGGNDTIRGGAGNDKITGGLGIDQLFGNAGADKFIFKSVAESLAADPDTIADFKHSQHDKIDLHLIDAVDDLFQTGNQAFHFINSGFSGIGVASAASAGELRFDAGSHKVEGDINGDGTADFAILVNVAVDLVKGDFIL